MKSAIVAGIVALGFLLLVASGLWPRLFPPTRHWTSEKAERMSKVKAEINNVGAQIYKAGGRTYGGRDPGELKAEYDSLIKEFEQLKTDFESATGSTATISQTLKWSGISLAVLGLIGYYAVKNMDS